MSQVITEEIPKIPDYRKMVFRGIKGRKLGKLLLLTILVLGGAAAVLHFTGKLPGVIDWIKNLFQSAPK